MQIKSSLDRYSTHGPKKEWIDEYFRYKNDFFEGKLTTITRFINNLYDQWESPSTEINQRAAIDNLIGYMCFDEMIDEDIDVDDIRLSLKRNRSYVVKSIKIMFELGMDPGNHATVRYSV